MEQLNTHDMTVLWHGWLKKLGGFSKRWKRRYFIFVSMPNGMKELRHYDAQKDVTALLASAPKGVIAMVDATGICCFLPPSPSSVGARKHTMFNRLESHDDGANADRFDQKFAVLTPLHVHMLAFNNGNEWASASESQQGLSLLASLSAFYRAVDVLHTGYMSKKRERTVHPAAKPSMISYWKRHYFVFLSSGDLLYFRDDTLSELQGRVDVRHAPTVRVTGERIQEDPKKKEIGALLLKFAKLPGGGVFENRENACLVWIATPPSKLFVIKVQDDSEGNAGGGGGSDNAKRQELTASAKKWLFLLLQGHAETKHSQLEQCISLDKYETTPEIVSAVRAGIPDELRGAMWKGFSGAGLLQRRAELKQTIRKVSKTTSIRTLTASSSSSSSTPKNEPKTVYDQWSEPLDPSQRHTPESRMILSRLTAVAMHDATLQTHSQLNRTAHGAPLQETQDTSSGSEAAQTKSSLPQSQSSRKPVHSSVYPSDSTTAEWDATARRRLLIASSRFNPYSHPCAWRAASLLLAYLDEDSTFWVINSLQDVYLPGYFHGHRPALQVDARAFGHLLDERCPALAAHLKSLTFSIDRTMEKWFLSLFTSSLLPVPTVLRIWDAFFAQGVRIFFGVGIALFLRAEANLFQAKTAQEAHAILSASERTCIDADALFSQSFADDFNISWLSEDRFDRIRAHHRHRVVDHVTSQLEMFKDKQGMLSQLHDHIARLHSTAQQLYSASRKTWGVQNNKAGNDDVVDDDDGGDGTLSLTETLKTLEACLKTAADAMATLDTKINTRQAKWLALSSQLAGCPLTRGNNSSTRVTSDLQSWLIQVKEGKISGAGLDALPDDAQGERSGFMAMMLMNTVNQYELFFEHGPTSGGDDGDNGPSCLVAYKEAFSCDDPFETEAFLYVMVSTLRAACSARLECLAMSQRFEWHGSRWLQSPIEFYADTTVSPFVDQRQTSHRSASRTLQRASSTASKSDHQVLTTRTSLDDSMLRRPPAQQYQQPASTVQALALANDNGSPHYFGAAASPSVFQYNSPLYDPLAVSSASPAESTRRWWDQDDNINYGHDYSHPLVGRDPVSPVDDLSMKSLHGLSAQYAHGEQVFHTAVDAMMSCFSSFIRVDSRRQSPSSLQRTTAWRERALLLEDDLVQELRSLAGITQQTKQLF